jgi:hypothetical protein
MKHAEKCPYKLISTAEGLMCFDPWLAEYLKPSENAIKEWCSGDFGLCPRYLDYEEYLRSGMRKHFIL